MTEFLQKGNDLFVDEKFEEALQYYNQAVNSDPSKPEYLLKRSTCHFKLENYTDAVADANNALKIDPNNPQAYLKKGMACFALDEFEAAKSAFEKGQQLEASSTFKTWIRKCNAELEIEEEEEQKQQQKVEAKVEKVENEKKNESIQPSSSIQPSPSTNLPNTFPPTNPNNTAVIGGVKIRHEWYQTNTHVILTVFAKNVPKESTVLEFQSQHLFFVIKFPDGQEYKLDIDLFDKISPSESSSSYMSTKIEIKLKKENQGLRWNFLEHTGEKLATQKLDTTAKAPSQKKNWDKIAEEVTKGENLDDEGDPLNKVFQNIYSNATEEQRRAMQKSFLESGGTVLSTNWEEVGKEKVKGSPPQGMEMHQWGKE